MRLVTAILFLSALPAAADYNPATGTGTVPAAAIAAAFGWSPAEYAANAGNLTFKQCVRVSWGGTVTIVPPSGMLYSKEAPGVVSQTDYALAGTAGAGGVTLGGFNGGPTVIFGPPAVGAPYNPFGPGYAGSWTAVKPGTDSPRYSVIATLPAPGGPRAVSIWAR